MADVGLSHIDAARLAAKLTPTISAPAKTEHGHGRGKTQPADKTDIGLRGVPVIGHGSGAISLTAPGGELGNAARLEQAGRDILRGQRNRFRGGELVIEMQRYIDPPGNRLAWRSYMVHVAWRRRDWWVCISLPVGLATRP